MFIGNQLNLGRRPNHIRFYKFSRFTQETPKGPKIPLARATKLHLSDN